jgi:hypothetical protein
MLLNAGQTLTKRAKISAHMEAVIQGTDRAEVVGVLRREFPHIRWLASMLATSDLQVYGATETHGGRT